MEKKVEHKTQTGFRCKCMGFVGVSSCVCAFCARILSKGYEAAAAADKCLLAFNVHESPHKLGDLWRTSLSLNRSPPTPYIVRYRSPPS